jgi:predicted small metal-binding protein
MSRFVASAATDDEVIERIENHMVDDHPGLVGKVTRDDLLSWIEETDHRRSRRRA